MLKHHKHVIEVGKTSLIPVVAVINSATESFEVTMWYDPSRAHSKQVQNEALAISKKLYAVIVEAQRGNVPEDKMIAVGTGGQIFDMESSKTVDLTKKVHYAWYRGHCLDPKKLSYFIPEKTLAEGDMTLEETRKL